MEVIDLSADVNQLLLDGQFSQVLKHVGIRIAIQNFGKEDPTKLAKRVLALADEYQEVTDRGMLRGIKVPVKVVLDRTIHISDKAKGEDDLS